MVYFGHFYTSFSKKTLKLDFSWVNSTTVMLHRYGASSLKKEARNP